MGLDNGLLTAAKLIDNDTRAPLVLLNDTKAC